MKKGKKASGGLYHDRRKKKHYERQGQPRIVKIGDNKKRKIRTLGGKKKTVLLTAEKVNVFDSKIKKAKVVNIKNVLETPQNRFLSRQNVLQKGTIIETDLGKARITNRPSQEGSVQAVLIHEEKK